MALVNYLVPYGTASGNRQQRQHREIVALTLLFLSTFYFCCSSKRFCCGTAIDAFCGLDTVVARAHTRTRVRIMRGGRLRAYTRAHISHLSCGGAAAHSQFPEAEGCLGARMKRDVSMRGGRAAHQQDDARFADDGTQSNSNELYRKLV
jgi:hypothetical protein